MPSSLIELDGAGWHETLRLLVHFVTMDERQTLRVMAWSIGGLVGVLFFLNAVALSMTSTAPRSSSWPGKEQLLIAQPDLVLLDRDHVGLFVGIDQPRNAAGDNLR